ncbi:LysR family transcriptional regulator [Aquimarina sp. MMG015]|uniref:winged helix-turn-helix domain-containing protein n=1 Tax=Aquimarina TaxID=290174 RepID=UPI000412D7B1|nr:MULTISPECIES: LysR family transcriptional regulator [Aquimarina]AXT55891.1 LysR family transcriptional regulator [Aquimarina sp. AD1]MBQ4805332.1 LysR family transcriptional regulator [Aquimarina sp. MMG015]RKN16701.1 LysR family transcriptional regulator [Aquimarina sp. AD1]
MYHIKSRIWIEGEKGVFLGEGRIKILKAIKTEGSLSKAAKSLGMSYKKAWNLVDSINKNASTPVVITNTGGSGGGGTEITEYGLKMINAFENINKNCWDFLDQQLKELQL